MIEVPVLGEVALPQAMSAGCDCYCTALHTDLGDEDWDTVVVLQVLLWLLELRDEEQLNDETGIYLPLKVEVHYEVAIHLVVADYKVHSSMLNVEGDEMPEGNVAAEVVETEGNFQLDGSKSGSGKYFDLMAVADADLPHPE